MNDPIIAPDKRDATGMLIIVAACVVAAAGYALAAWIGLVSV